MSATADLRELFFERNDEDHERLRRIERTLFGTDCPGCIGELSGDDFTTSEVFRESSPEAAANLWEHTCARGDL